MPLALHFAKEGASVIGADIDEEKVNLIKHGICPANINLLVETFNQVHSNNNLQVTSGVTEAVQSSQIHIFCVPTPLCGNKLPDLGAVVATAEALSKGLKKGDLAIDIAKARKLLQYRPETSLASGMRRYTNWQSEKERQPS